jgi:FAD synthetase
MSLEKLVSKYITSAEQVFQEVKMTESPISLTTTDTEKVLGFAKAYLDDAKYYRNEKRFEVSLASVAYCEGILDALRLLGVVNFKWPVKDEEKSER